VELVAASRFAGVAGWTLRARTSVRVELDGNKKGACQQQSTGKQKQGSFHSGTPFLEWIGKFNRAKLGWKSVDAAGNRNPSRFLKSEK